MIPTPCACKRKECKVELRYDTGSDVLLLTCKDGTEQGMYVDANTLVCMISNLRAMLGAMATR
jgi:hypothetical protein